MNDFYNDFYAEAEVQQILQMATREHQTTEAMSRVVLLATDAEIGIPQAAVLATEREWGRQRAEHREYAEFMRTRRHGFIGHLSAYLMVNTLLVALNFAQHGSMGWAVYPMLGWGIGLASNAAATFNRNGEAFRTAFAQWRETRRNGRALTDINREEQR